MAKYSIEISEALRKLFCRHSEGVEIHRAWIEGDKLVLDLRGPSIPDVENVRTESVTKQETKTTTWTFWETQFVPENFASEDELVSENEFAIELPDE